jgi:transposase
MFSVSSACYYLFRDPTDMRKSFDGLCGLVSGRLGQDPRSGDVFIFINKKRTLAKLLRWEPGGFVLFYKRLESGTFELPLSKSTGLSQTMEYSQLAMMVDGFSLKYAKKRKRF